MDRNQGRARGSGPLWLGLLSVVLAFSAGGLALWTFGPGVSVDPLAAGLAAYRQGDWRRAAEVARDRLKGRPEEPAALRLLARATARLGRDESALSLYQRLGARAMAAEDHFLRAGALGRAGKTAAAVAELEAARAADPDHPETLEALARVYTRDQRLDDALAAAEALARQPGWEARGRLMAGVLRIQVNDPAGGAECLALALDVDQGKAVAGATADPARFEKELARALLRVDKAPEAEARLRATLARSPDDEASWLLSRALLRQGKITEAVEARDRSVAYAADHKADPEPSHYVGEKACAGCHSAVFEASQRSRHTRSYYHGFELTSLPLPPGPLPDPADPGVTHVYKKEGGAVRAETRVGPELYRAVVDYAFGTPDRYLTMVKRDGAGSYRACRLSHFEGAGGSGWDLSAGDEAHGEASEQFLGKPVASQGGVARCLYCHTTNPRSGKTRTGPETADRAIGCERCHGPGGNHVAAVAAGFPDLAVAIARGAPADAVGKLCADCHNLNPPEVLISTPRTDPGWVRSPGVTLTWSRCSTESGGALTCLTCHDPHREAKAAAGPSEQACLSCHSGSDGGKTRTPCPVNPRSGCVGCHMPPVPNPALHLSLTDHFIRVRREKAPGRP